MCDKTTISPGRDCYNGGRVQLGPAAEPIQCDARSDFLQSASLNQAAMSHEVSRKTSILNSATFPRWLWETWRFSCTIGAGSVDSVGPGG